MPESFPASPIGQTVAPCPLSKPKPTHWVSIELVGEDEKGIAFEEYCITLPDQSQRTGLLDEQGCARIDGLPDVGVCSITFPKLDTEAWQFVESKGARKNA